MGGGRGGHKECSRQEECLCAKVPDRGERCEAPETGKVAAVPPEEGMGFMACAGKEYSNALTFNLSVHSGKRGILFTCCRWGALGL